MKKRTVSLILISLAVFLLALTSIFSFNYLKDSDKVKNIIIHEANKKINGTVELGKLHWCFEEFHLGLQTDLLTIKNLQGGTFAEAKNLSVLIKWNSLIKGFNSLLRLKSDFISINIEKNALGQWNFKEILKKRKSKKKFSVDDLNIDTINLYINDKVKNSTLEYDDLTLSWKKQSKKHSYLIDLRTNKSLSKNHTSNIKNFIELNGILNTAPLRKSYKKDFDLKIKVRNLNLNQVPTLNAEGVLNIEGKLHNINKMLNLDLNGFFNNLCFLDDQGLPNNKVSNIHIDTNISFNKRHMIIRNININWEDLMVYLSGRVLKWRQRQPKLDLHLITEKLNLEEVFEAIPLKLIPQKLKHIMLDGKYDGSIQSDLRIQGKKNTPSIDGYLNIMDLHSNLNSQKTKPITKNIFLDFKYHNKDIVIQKLSVLFERSTLLAAGSINIKSKIFNIGFQGDDLNIEEIQRSIRGLPHFKKLTTFISEFRLQGNSDIQGMVGKKSEQEKIKFDSQISLDHVNIFSPKYALNYKNISGQIEIKDKFINLKQISGQIDRGVLNINGSIQQKTKKEPLTADIQLSGKKLNILSFTNPRTQRLFSINYPVKKAFGEIKFLEIDLKHYKNQTLVTGTANIRDISFQKNHNSPLLSNINGEVTFLQNFWKLQNLKFKFNNAAVVLNGNIDNPLSKQAKQPLITDVTDLDIKVKNAKISDLIYAANLHPNVKAISKPQDSSGWVTLGAKLKGKNVSGTIDFEKINITDPKLKYPLTDLQGTASLEESLINIKALSGYYGKSSFKIKGNIENFLDSSEILWDLNLDGQINAQEIMTILPQKVNRLIRASGTLPLKATLQGSKHKNLLDFEALISKLDLFSFSTWLKISKEFQVTLKGKLSITPGSVVSTDTSLEIVDINSLAEVKPFSIVNSSFQAKNIKSPDLRFRVDINSADKHTRLRLIGPHIKAIDPINLKPRRGFFDCSVSGTRGDHQTLCHIYGKTATLEKFGIGDLNGQNINVDLLAMTNKPVLSHITASKGDWDKVPFTNLKLDLVNTARTVEVKNLTTNIKDGKASASLDLNLKTQKSNFEITGDTLPAHEFANALWKLGEEIPEGTFNIDFTGNTEGMDEESIFYNLVGKANVIAKNGKLSDLVSMQKILSALNTFKEGLISFDLNNVMNTLVSYKGGHFDYIISSLNYDHGKVSTDKLLLKSHQMDIIAKGEMDFPNDSLTASGEGALVRHASSVLKKVGVGRFNLGNAASILSPNTAKEKVLPSDSKHRFFRFRMTGKISDQDETAQSLRNNFIWL